MQALYIQASERIIRNKSTKYIHPTTGEVYGNTDWERADKLAEIGALPLRDEYPEAGYQADGWEIVWQDSEYVRRPTSVSLIPQPTDAEQAAQDLAASDYTFVTGSARMLEDITDERVADGKYVSQAVKDAAAARKALRDKL